MRQPVVKELDKIHVCLHTRKFCRPTSGIGVLANLLLRLDWTRVFVHRKSVNIKSVTTMTATMTPCSTAKIVWKKHTANLALTASRFPQTLLQESFRRKWWLSFKVEIWKYTKNKLLKLVNSLKADFLFAGLNRNRIIQKNRCQKKGPFLKNKGHLYLNVES